MSEQERTEPWVERVAKLGKRFPVQDELINPQYNYGLKSVPYDFVLEHEKQMMENHGGQTVQRMAERGGLSARELVLVISNQPLSRFWEINWDQVNPHHSINHALVFWLQNKLFSEATEVKP